MASVTFRDGFIVDDTAGPNGLAGGGHRVRFVPALSHAVDVALEAKNWASLLGSVVFDGEYSAKEYSVGTVAPLGSSKSWATKTAGTVAGGEYSAKEYAIGITVPAGSAKEWATITGELVDATEYSAKEYAVGTTVESAKRHASGVVTTGSAKDWATKEAGTVAGGDYSAKEYAIGSTVPAGSARFHAFVAQNSTNFKGIYSAATIYNIGEIVVFNNLRYIKLTTTAAGVTPVDGANWFKISEPEPLRNNSTLAQVQAISLYL